MAMTSVLGAAAQEVKPTVSPAPLELRRKPTSLSKKDTEQLLGEFERLVRAAGARIPTPSEISIAILALKRQDFATSDEALAQLAQKVQTLYAVHLQIDYPMTGTVVGVGKVVRADGKRMNSEVRVERSRESRTYLQATMETVIAVLEKLDLQRLPSAMPVAALKVPDLRSEAPATVNVEPAPPPSVLVPERVAQRSSIPLGGKILAVGGAVILVGGAVALGLAASDARRLTPDARQYLPADQVDLYRGAKAKETAGAALLGVGAAVAITGAVLWLLGGEPRVTVAISPTPDGVAAAVSGGF